MWDYKKLKELRENKGISQVEFAEKIGVSKQLLYKYETGIITNIPADKIQSMAEVLNVSPAYLMGWSDNLNFDSNVLELSNVMKIDLKRFPVLGEIACGKPIYADQDFETYIEASSSINADFCLIAKGESMINARIYDGDVVFVREQSIVNNGEIAAVVIGDEATLKRWYYYPEKKKLVLNPENPAYEPLVYVGEELNTIRCLGKAVSFISKL